MPKVSKLLRLLRRREYASALLKHWVAAGVEHEAVLAALDCDWIVDVGANVGQFALVARRAFPEVNIFSFEPQLIPAQKFTRVFAKDSKITLFQSAIGPSSGQALMHVSAQAHSSSLLPISSLQSDVFPGTGEVGTVSVDVAPLDAFLKNLETGENGLLKVDVQGYELEVLKGAASLLSRFSWIYIEASFVELYEGQALVHEVIDFLRTYGFSLVGLFQPHVGAKKQTIQGDFLFRSRRQSIDPQNSSENNPLKKPIHLTRINPAL